ncbi:MAG TPA: GNAT family N-acetyltransferase [Paucimonas sp.]|nr:GNAT family N-acetyltransferase [Paucimonas sp.]
MELHILKADYRDPQHAHALIGLLDLYARDPMGGGEPLRAEVKERLVPMLAQHPTAFSILAFAGDEPAGLANCFEGFSTFACKPLVNIHDFVVSPAWRGHGVGQRMMAYLEALARERGCCKVTLEVLENNHAAKALYRKCGFADYRLAAAAGNALFWQKYL